MVRITTNPIDELLCVFLASDVDSIIMVFWKSTKQEEFVLILCKIPEWKL